MVCWFIVNSSSRNKGHDMRTLIIMELQAKPQLNTVVIACIACFEVNEIQAKLKEFSVTLCFYIP